MLRVASRRGRQPTIFSAGLLQLVLLAVCFALANPTAAARADDVPAQGKGTPRISTPTTDLDLGVVLEGESRTKSVRVENQGDAPLRIMRVHPSCGCTLADVVHGTTGEKIVLERMKPMGVDPMAVLQPGEHIDVVITYRSLGQPHRRNTKYVDVFSNDPHQDRLRVSLSIEVKKAYSLEPRTLQLGSVQRGGELRGRVVFTPEKDVPIRVTGVSPTPGMETELHVLTLEGGAPAYAIDVIVRADGPPGSLSRTLGLLTNHSEFLTIKVPVFAEIVPAVRIATDNAFNSQLIDFGTLDPGSAHRRTIEITNAAPEIPYRATSVTVEGRGPSGALQTEIETLEDGVRYRVHVTVPANLDARFFKGSLVIHADHPEQRESRIYYSGWFKSKT